MEGLKNEVVEGMSSLLSKKVTDYTIDGKCSGCGNCCPDMLSLSMGEVIAIEEYVKKHNIQPHVVGVPLVNAIDATCPFLNMNKKTDRCNIYPVRPYICRIFHCNDTDMRKHIDDPKLRSVERHRVSMRQTFFPSEAMKAEVNKMFEEFEKSSNEE